MANTVIEITDAELKEQLEKAKRQGEAEALKKKLPEFETTEKSVNANEVGFALRLGLAAKSMNMPIDEVAKNWKKQAGTFYKNANEVDRIVKGMQAGTFSTGGWLLAPNYANELIPSLKEKAVVRSKAQIVPMVNGNIIYRTEGTGATAYWVGEGETITKSDVAGGQVKMESKKLAGLVVISNDLLRYASPELDSMVENDLTTELALKEDLAFLRGTGTTNMPQSFKTLVSADNQFTMTATPTYLTVENDLQKAKYLLRTANIPMLKPCWFISPRTEFYLGKLRDGNGFYLYKDEMLNKGTIMGIPYSATSQIPDNLGTGSNTSEITLVDMAQVLVGKDLDTQIEYFPNGTYMNGSTAVSGISSDESVIRAIMKTCLGMKYAKAGAIISGVTWGAE